MQTKLKEVGHISQNSMKLDPLAKLRLKSEFFLISDEKEKALQNYDEILKLGENPYLYIIKAKLLEILERYSEATGNFKKAINLSSLCEEERLEVLKLILDLEDANTGLLQKLANEAFEKESSTVVQKAPPRKELIQKKDVGDSECSVEACKNFVNGQTEIIHQKAGSLNTPHTGIINDEEIKDTQLTEIIPGGNLACQNFNHTEIINNNSQQTLEFPDKTEVISEQREAISFEMSNCEKTEFVKRDNSDQQEKTNKSEHSSLFGLSQKKNLADMKYWKSLDKVVWGLSTK